MYWSHTIFYFFILSFSLVQSFPKEDWSSAKPDYKFNNLIALKRSYTQTNMLQEYMREAATTVLVGGAANLWVKIWTQVSYSDLLRNGNR